MPSVPAATAPAASVSGSAAASAASAAAPTTAGEPGPFRVVGDAPVIPRVMVPHRGAILPGAVAVHDGTYHAWVIAFGDPPGTQEIHHLTSPDAVEWTEAADESLEALSDGLGNPGAMPTSVARAVGGWAMYFVGTLATERQGWDVWMATAPDPGGPWTRGDEPVLRRGPAGAWDAGGLDFPTVLRAGGPWTMVYSGQDPTRPEAGSIGLATSDDGITWTKHDDPATTDAGFAESDPVIEPGLCGAFDTRGMHQPRVLDLGERLVMTYAGWGVGDTESRLGLAESTDDGLAWRCLWPSPALDPAGLPDGFVHTQAAFVRDGRTALLVEWFADGGTDVWLAEAARLP